MIKTQSELIAHLIEEDPNIIWEKLNDSIDEKTEGYNRNALE